MWASFSSRVLGKFWLNWQRRFSPGARRTGSQLYRASQIGTTGQRKQKQKLFGAKKGSKEEQKTGWLTILGTLGHASALLSLLIWGICRFLFPFSVFFFTLLPDY